MKTLVIGASENPDRYANQAVRLLDEYKHEIVAVGLREGIIGNIPIQAGQPAFDEVDTVSLYVGPQRQDDLVDYVIGLRPRRVIFNPGTENPAFEAKLQAAGIEPLEACTLVMLRTAQW
ncbi:MAG TPA: CoA-binding protein [Oceanipulchritudo sp.]|nr:CoA-binding protein [Oceanipulchritudo sp.]